MTHEQTIKYTEELKKLGIEHQILTHPSLVEAEKVQAYFNDDLSGSVPTLIMKAGEEFVAVLKRGDVKLDSGKLKKILGVNNLRLANKEEFEKVTGVPLGAARVYVPGMKTLIDKSVFTKEHLNGGSGTFTETIKYKTADLRKIPGSILVEVTEKPDDSKKRIFAGMRPTGRLHLGNYLGSAKGMLTLQADPKYDTVFMVVDLHGITTPFDVKNYQESIRNVMKDYLAIGLDPDKSILTVQSRVPEHLELAYLLSSVTTIAKMTHLPTFKEKVKQYPEHSTMALLNYPILMAADILIYKGELVPVGIDQEPHLEVAREVARRMNDLYGTDFPEPQRFATAGSYVPSLTGEGKMSKSVEGSYISLTDDLQTIRTKLAKAPTDAGGPGDVPKTGPVANLFKFMELFRQERLEYYGQLYGNGKLRYLEMKEDLAQAVFEEIRPIQERRAKITDEYVQEVIEEGAKKARVIAQGTVEEVKKKMGLL